MNIFIKTFPLFVSIALAVHSGLYAAIPKSVCETIGEGQMGKFVYSSDDSLAVTELLKHKCDDNDILSTARMFIGVPYVAHTLEVADPEKVVVDLSGFDCSTFVETVCALVLTKRQKSDIFSDYCKNLEKIRYREGVCTGYCSRLHYFSWWIRDNIQKGVVEEIVDSVTFVDSMLIDNWYMSRYPEKYRMLRGCPSRVQRIFEFETLENGNSFLYLGKDKIRCDVSDLSCIHDGDIVGIVTSRPGLDFSHLGFASWGSDGHLHLLNASSMYKSVVEDMVPLGTYLKRNSYSLGIRVFRLK